VANDYVVSVNCDEQDDSKQKTTILIKKHASNTISHQKRAGKKFISIESSLFIAD